MFQKRSLTAADGAELHALIEEMPDSDWRAVGIVRLDNKSEVQQQPVGIEMFPIEAEARAWVDCAAKAKLCSNMTGICLKASNPASSESYVSSLKGPNPMPQGPSQSRSSI